MASTMEQISAETWRDAIEESVEAALRDITARGLEAHETPPPDQPALQAPPVIAEAEPPVPMPLSNREFAAALQPGPTPAPSGGTSRS